MTRWTLWILISPMYNNARLWGRGEEIKPRVCCFFYITQTILFFTSGNHYAKHPEPWPSERVNSHFSSELVHFQHGLLPSSLTFPQSCIEKDIANLRIYPSLTLFWIFCCCWRFFCLFVWLIFLFLQRWREWIFLSDSQTTTEEMCWKPTNPAVYSCSSAQASTQGKSGCRGCKWPGALNSFSLNCLTGMQTSSPPGKPAMHTFMSTSALLSRPLILSLNQQCLRFSRWPCSAKQVPLSHSEADKSASETILLFSNFSSASNFLSVAFELPLLHWCLPWLCLPCMSLLQPIKSSCSRAYHWLPPSFEAVFFDWS